MRPLLHLSTFLLKKKTRIALQLPDSLIIFRKGERILLQVEKKDIYWDHVRLGRRLSFGKRVIILSLSGKIVYAIPDITHVPSI